MKKNKMMRLASGLLVAVLITTSTISGTYAKYVTEGQATDSARVAKWGVTITADGSMFADSYLNTETTYTSDEDVETIAVQADTEGTNVVAPGTEGALADYTVTGIPEVDALVTYTATLTLAGWEVDVTDDGVDNPTNYCPIVFTIVANGNTTVVNANGDMTMAAIKTAVEAEIVKATKRYHTNEDLSAVANDLAVSWKWPFETGADDVAKAANNVKDTALGDAAAAGSPATIALATTITIEQID